MRASRAGRRARASLLVERGVNPLDDAGYRKPATQFPAPTDQLSKPRRRVSIQPWRRQRSAQGISSRQDKWTRSLPRLIASLIGSTSARLSAPRELPPLRTTDVFASKLCCANLDAVTGRIGARTPKMLGRSPSSSSFALMPNNVVGRNDLPKSSTGYREGA
jgi:hypothetical protein